MFDFIALKDYAFVYYNFLILFVLLTYLDANQLVLTGNQNLRKKNMMGIILLLCTVVYMGLRPISFNYFGDMGMYNVKFEKYVDGAKLDNQKDFGFEIFTYLCARIMTPNTFFLTCAALYVLPLYVASKKFFKEYWFYSFLCLLSALSFWAYGVNGIRNGLASSFFILGLSRDSKYWRYALFALAYIFHGSLVIPIVVYALTSFYTDTNRYLFGWFLAIPLSVALGGFWESFFFSLGFGQEERLDNYLTAIGEFDENFSQTGFRWDFVLYSASGVFAGWYFLIKKKYEDPLYRQIFNLYLTTNAFWILVIRANFSNRFAYLSWFILPLVIVYPLLRMEIIPRQHRTIGIILVLNFAFTYIINGLLR